MRLDQFSQVKALLGCHPQPSPLTPAPFPDNTLKTSEEKMRRGRSADWPTPSEQIDRINSESNEQPFATNGFLRRVQFRFQNLTHLLSFRPDKTANDFLILKTVLNATQTKPLGFCEKPYEAELCSVVLQWGQLTQVPFRIYSPCSPIPVAVFLQHYPNTHYSGGRIHF